MTPKKKGALGSLLGMFSAAPAKPAAKPAVKPAVKKAAKPAAKKAPAKRTLVVMLTEMAALETEQKSCAAVDVQQIIKRLGTDEGRASLRAATGKALTKYPDSVLLLYVQALALAQGGLPLEAQQNITNAIARCVKEGKTGPAKTRFDSLSKIWRITDSISRDQMQWSEGNEGDDQESSTPAEAEEEAGSMFFAEPLLQGRQQDKYLLACRQHFSVALDPKDKLKAIQDMVRAGLRRMPDYHAAYAAARESYGELRPSLELIFENEFEESAGRVVALCCVTLRLARKLSLHADVDALERRLLGYMREKAVGNKLWRIARVLVERPDPKLANSVRELIVEAKRQPAKPGEVNEYLAWAYRSGEYDMAHALFGTLTAPMRKTVAMRYYVEILKAEGSFARAASMARAIHTSYLSKAYNMCPLTVWKLWKRVGEMTFAAETAALYSSVPQPVDPVGVLFLSPRNFDLMRRLPLVVLMELKRRGWAVIPLIRGILPLEPTGRPEINQFLGCLQLPDFRLAPHAEQAFTRPEGFHADVAKGELRWNDLDLSQALWEDAAINRRRYNIDYSCPDLVARMSKLADLTYLMAMVLENAHRVMTDLGLPCGHLTGSQARLPDAVIRLYCASHGDTRNFFCVHAANGYQNYFTNLTHPYSTKMSVRNVTTPANVRTAIFPEPQEFEAFYRKHKADATMMLGMVGDITKLRRVGKSSERSRDALLCQERIRRWREAGGKVACAFGKIVCDSAVPYDGGPAHRNLKDWINHTVLSVAGSKTLLLIKPHPYEIRNEIGAFLTEFFQNLIEVPLPENVIILGHDWFTMDDMQGMIDIGLLYNSTTAIELGLLGIPSVQSSEFGPIDYPIGHMAPRDREHYARMVRFEEPLKTPPDLPERAAAWIYYMSGDNVALPYRYHARPATNRVIYPPWWFDDDIGLYLVEGDPYVEMLTDRITGTMAGQGTAAIPLVERPNAMPSLPQAPPKPAEPAPAPAADASALVSALVSALTAVRPIEAKPEQPALEAAKPAAPKPAPAKPEPPKPAAPKPAPTVAAAPKPEVKPAPAAAPKPAPAPAAPAAPVKPEVKPAPAPVQPEAAKPAPAKPEAAKPEGEAQAKPEAAKPANS